MGDTTIADTGSNIFGGNELSLNATRVSYNLNTLLSFPPLPGAGSIAEVDNLGWKNPAFTVRGIIQKELSHAQAETGSEVDFYFLRDLAQNANIKQLRDDLFGSGGSVLEVQIESLTFDRSARKEEDTAKIPYQLNLIETSGTL